MPHLGHGKICHLALPASDVEASARFYEEAFGWAIHRSDRVTTFDDGVDEVSGHFVPHRKPTEPGILVYIWVDDLDAAVEQVTAAGGRVTHPEGVDPGERTAWFLDPGGNRLGIYQEPSPGPRS